MSVKSFLVFLVVACEIGRKIAQEGVKRFLPPLSQVIYMPIRATGLPLDFMGTG